jgi:hypothetical protein
LLPFASFADFGCQEQQVKMQEIQYRIPDLEAALDDVVTAELECKAANVEENDYTIFTCQDLQFELELVMHGIQKKITFIENQVLPLRMCIFLC